MIAAANPLGGRYDVTRNFSENVALTDPILTRFDILCVLLDEPSPELDERLASFVVDSHAHAHPEVQKVLGELQASTVSPADAADIVAKAEALAGPRLFVPPKDGTEAAEPIPQGLLRKYITMAKATKPSLAGIDQDKIAKLYADLRKESEISNGIPIAVRHIESVIRMSEASARMHLRDTVSTEDVDFAIRVMVESFIAAQKHAVGRALRAQFSRYLDSSVSVHELLRVKLRELSREKRAEWFVKGGLPPGVPLEVSFKELATRCQRNGISVAAIREAIAEGSTGWQLEGDTLVAQD